MAPVDPTRKAAHPYRAALNQHWGANIVAANHEEALYAFGELSLFTLMWRPADLAAGRVSSCRTCAPDVLGARVQAAFKQPEDRECLDCFGTTFSGGWRAQIVRPAIWADRNAEETDEARGVVVRDTLQIETTADFTLSKGDYAFRFDGTRFQMEAKREAVIRDGFSAPDPSRGFVGSSTAHREEETSVAFKIPPSGQHLIERLDHAQAFLAYNLAEGDTVKPNGYLM